MTDDNRSSPVTQKRMPSSSSNTNKYWNEQELIDALFDSLSPSTVLSMQGQSTAFRFETEPRETFRGRTDGEVKPLTSTTHDGEPIESRVSSYVLDRNNQRLSLLILEKCLFSTFAEYRLQICLVTREIHGYIYNNPYFKFQVDRYGNTILNENPIFLPINITDLEDYSPRIKKLQ